MNYLKILIFLLVASLSAHATTNQELFLRGNNFYQTGQYQKALDSYQAISNKTSVVFYDIGLCFYKLGKLGHALWGFKQALAVASCKDYDMISDAIDQIQKSLGVERDTSVRHTLYRMLRRATAGTSLLLWQLMVLLSMYLFCFLCVWYRRTWWVRMVSILWGVWLLISILILTVKWIEMTTKRAIVVAERLEIFSGPYQDCHIQGTLDYGQEIVILDGSNDWYKIKSGLVTGWVMKKSIMPIQ